MWTNWRKVNYEYFKKELDLIKKDNTNYKDLKLVNLGAGTQRFKPLTAQFNLTAVDFYRTEGIDVTADLTKQFPFEEGSFDIVFASNVLEHISNPQHFLDESYRILKPGGVLLGAVPFMAKVHGVPYDYGRYAPDMFKIFLNKFSSMYVESLGNPRDVYLTSASQYFKLVKGYRVLKKIHDVFVKFLPLAERSNHFTEGHCFKAVK